MTGPDPLLVVADLHVHFGDAHVVRGTGFDVQEGEVLAVVGESGSGKSVTALAVMGLLPRAGRAEGSVRLRGRELLGLRDRELAPVRGGEIAMVFQDPVSSFTPVRRVGDQIAEAVRIHGCTSRRAATTRAAELLSLAGLPGAERAFPHELSGGQCRRATIAMALAGDPSVILADEPTAALDAIVRARVLECLQEVRERTGAALVLITHDLGVVAGHADRVVVMYAGRPVETGPVEDVYDRPRMPYTIGLLGSAPPVDRSGGRPPAAGGTPGCPFEPRCPIAVEECRTTEPPLRRVGGPRHRAACVRAAEVRPAVTPVPRAAAWPPRERRTPVLEVDGLVKHYTTHRTVVRAVDGIGFDVRAGETLGLIGESGCGKTTALLEILRLRTPQAGRVTVLGRDTSALSAADRRRLRRDLQIVFQDPLASLDPRMRAGAILAEPLRAHGGYDVGARVPELLRLVGLDPAHAHRYPGDLSGGQRQRVGIARALALEPKLVIMDEPFSALDVSVQAGIVDLLGDLKAGLGLAFLLASHDLTILRRLADRVAVMHRGRIAEIGDADTVYRTPAHPYTQVLLAAVPVPDPRAERARRRVMLRETSPDPGATPSGCRFRTRCPVFALLAIGDRRRCAEEEPDVRPVGAGQAAACHFAGAR
jgi:peptide/nickel transport system ATP-binding protein